MPLAPSVRPHPGALYNVWTYLFKDSYVGAEALSGHDPGTAHQPGGQVVNNVTVQVGHHHHIKLMRVGHQLKGE